MLSGLVRPGVSFGPEDWRAARNAPSFPETGFLAKLEMVGICGAIVALALFAFTAALFLFAIGYTLTH